MGNIYSSPPSYHPYDAQHVDYSGRDQLSFLPPAYGPPPGYVAVEGVAAPLVQVLPARPYQAPPPAYGAFSGEAADGVVAQIPIPPAIFDNAPPAYAVDVAVNGVVAQDDAAPAQVGRDNAGRSVVWQGAKTVAGAIVDFFKSWINAFAEKFGDFGAAVFEAAVALNISFKSVVHSKLRDFRYFVVKQFDETRAESLLNSDIQFFTQLYNERDNNIKNAGEAGRKVFYGAGVVLALLMPLLPAIASIS